MWDFVIIDEQLILSMDSNYVAISYTNTRKQINLFPCASKLRGNIRILWLEISINQANVTLCQLSLIEPWNHRYVSRDELLLEWGNACVCVGWEGVGGQSNDMLIKSFKKTKTKKPNGDRWVSGIKSSLKFNAMVVIIIFILNYPSQLCVWWKVELCISRP